MEAVFHNPEWQRQCAAFSGITLAGQRNGSDPHYDEKALLPSTSAITESIPMAIPSVHALVQPPRSVSKGRKPIQASDLFTDLFM